MTSNSQDWKRLTLRYDATCSSCGISLKAGSPALWSASQRIVSCLSHSGINENSSEKLGTGVDVELPLVHEQSFSQGTAGGSAIAENARRMMNREKRINTKHPKVGKSILFFTDEPQSTKAWKKGAEGEAAIGKMLDSFARMYGFKVMHDRLKPKSRANIDHIVVTSAGIFVIDSKNYKGTVRIRYNGSFFSAPSPKLWVGRQNCMKFVDEMKKQTLIVKEILSRNSIDMPVIGVLAFYKADWQPYRSMRKQMEIEGVLINNKGIELIVTRQGPYPSTDIDEVTRLLASILKSAS